MKYKTFRSVLCLLLAVIMTGSLFNYALPVEAEAAYESWSKFNGIDTTKNPYFTGATGNGAEDMVAIAKEQLGKTESQLGYKSTSQWCASFIWNCAIAVGQTDAVPKGYQNAGNLPVAILRNGGTKVYYRKGLDDINGTSTITEGDIKNAQPGDIISYGNKETERSHVEIVYDVSTNTKGETVIRSIGGNYGDKVSGPHQLWPGKFKYICSIVRPAYSNAANTTSRLAPVATYEEATARISAYLGQCNGKYWTNKKDWPSHTQPKERDNRLNNLKTNADEGKYSENVLNTTGGYSNNFEKGLTHGLRECEGFVHYMSYVLFSEQGYVRPAGGYEDEIANPDQIQTTGGWKMVTQNDLSIEELKAFEVHPGDIIRYSTSKQHFVMVYQVFGNGQFSVVECNYDGANRIRSSTAITAKSNKTWSQSQLRMMMKDDSGCFVYLSPLTSVKTYTVTFDANGGSKTDPQVVIEDEAIGELPKPTRNGYAFQGWYTKKSGWDENDKVSTSTKVTGDVTYYAQWKKLYTVSYNANGGSGAPGSQSKTEGKALTLSKTTPTRSGYTFDHWCTKPNANAFSHWLLKKYTPGEKYTADKDITLYAHWEKSPVKSYTVTFDANGGSGTQKKTFNEGVSLGELPVPTRSGYNFQGWYTAASGGSQISSSTKVTKNVTYYAHWTKTAVKSYTVNFEYNAGNDTGECRQYKEGESLGELPAPTRSGYSLEGWYTAASGGRQISSSMKVTENVTYYAHWKQQSDYMASCTRYPSYGSVRVKVTDNIYSLPCDSGTDSHSVKGSAQSAGTWLSVDGLYKNSKGQYWYSVELSSGAGYFNAASTASFQCAPLLKDVTIENPSLPKDLVQDKSYSIGGTIRSDHLYLNEVTGSIQDSYGNGSSKTLRYSNDQRCASLNLKSSAINTALKFGSLKAGDCQYVITVSADYYYSTDGKSLNFWRQTEDLIWHEFKVKAQGKDVRFLSEGKEIYSTTVTEKDNYLTMQSKPYSKPGHTFKGWNAYRDSDSTWYTDKGWQTQSSIDKNKYTKKVYPAGNSYNLYHSSWGDSDFTFHAVWEYTGSGKDARFVSDGVVISSFHATPGNNILTIAAAPAGKPGYTFRGWNVQRDNDSTWYVAGHGWNSEGSIATNNYTKKLYAPGTKIDLYDLTWVDEASVTFYALWEYTGSGKDVRFVSDGAVISSFHATPGNNVLTVAAAPDGRPGYTFQGWNVQRDADGTWYVAGHGWNSEGSIAANKYTKKLYSSGAKIDLYDLTWVDEASVSFYALWEAPTSYAVTYDANGGTDAPAEQQKIAGTDLTLSDSEPSRPGYRFLGWAADSAATAPEYQPGDTYSADAVLTLYAVWEYLGSLEIPDVTGMYFGEAMQLLSLSGFRPQTSGTIYYSKYVATQSPAAGEYGEPGDAVTLTVTDTAPASVPRLVGKYPINDDAVRSWEEQGSATFVYGFNHQSICRCDTSTGVWEDLPYVTDKLCQVVLSFGPNSWARSFKMVIECEDTNCRARLYFGEDYYGSYNAILLHLNKGNYTVKAYDSSGALFDSAPLKVTGSGSYEVIFDAFTDEKNLAPNLVGMRFDEALALLEARGNGVERAEDFNDDDIVVKQWPFAGNFVYPNITFELTCSTTSAYKHVVIDPATGEGYAWSGNGDPISVQKDSLTQPLSSVTLRLIGSDYEDHPMRIVVGSSTKTAKLPISPDENGTVALYAVPGSQYTLGIGTSDGSYGFEFHVDGDGEIDLDLTHTVTIFYYHYVNSVLYKVEDITTSSFRPSITLCAYDVTKEGYTFAGWSTDGSNPVPPGRAITTDAKLIRLYPVWKENVPDGKKAVPDVTGMRFDEACALLKEQGFVVNETAYNADDIVIGQGPKAGILVEPGSAVELSCSVTSAYQYVVIDPVTGEGRAWSGAGNTIPNVVQKDSLIQPLNDVKLRITGSGYQGYPMVISKWGQSSPTFGLVVTPDENGEISILAAPNKYDLWIEATEEKALHFRFTVSGDGTIDIDLTRKINVSYYNEDGSLYKTDEVDTSSVFTTITLGAYDQVKDGYTFAGWSANGGTPNLPGSFVFTAFDISFTAVWTENTPDEEPVGENDAPKTYEAPELTSDPEPVADPEPSTEPGPTRDPEPPTDPEPKSDPEPSTAPEPTIDPEPSTETEKTPNLEPATEASE